MVNDAIVFSGIEGLTATLSRHLGWQAVRTDVASHGRRRHLAVLSVQRSPAERVSGDLQSLCRSQKAADRTACAFYIYGVAGGLYLGSKTAGSDREYCLPDSVGLVELTAQVQLMMVRVPDKTLAAESAVGATIRRQYPCPKK
jgi:hypothetical protein